MTDDLKNAGTVNPKGIPGATVRYTITLTNNGSEDASSVVVVDTTPANTTYVAESMTLDGGSLTDAVDGDEGDFGITNPQGVTVNVASVAQGGASAQITFDVVID